MQKIKMYIPFSNKLLKNFIKIKITWFNSHAFNNTSTSTTAMSELERELLLYSEKKQAVLSLKTLMETGNGDRLNEFETIFQKTNNSKKQLLESEKVHMQVACFLHRELPVRLAHRAVKLEAASIFIKSG
jgi:hypothetical protein